MARFALHPFSLGHRLPKDNVELISIVSEGNPGEFGVGFFGVTPALFVLVRFFLCWRKRKSGWEIRVSSLLSGLCLWFFSTDLRCFWSQSVSHFLHSIWPLLSLSGRFRNCPSSFSPLQQSCGTFARLCDTPNCDPETESLLWDLLVSVHPRSSLVRLYESATQTDQNSEWEKQHKNHPLPLGGSTVLSLSRGPLLFLFFDETQIWLGDLRVVLVVCLVCCLVWFDLPAFMDLLCPCTNVVLTVYAHVRTEPQCHIGHTRGKKKEPFSRTSGNRTTTSSLPAPQEWCYTNWAIRATIRRHGLSCICRELQWRCPVLLSAGTAQCAPVQQSAFEYWAGKELLQEPETWYPLWQCAADISATLPWCLNNTLSDSDCHDLWSRYHSNISAWHSILIECDIRSPSACSPRSEASYWATWSPGLGPSDLWHLLCTVHYEESKLALSGSLTVTTMRLYPDIRGVLSETGRSGPLLPPGLPCRSPLWGDG